MTRVENPEIILTWISDTLSGIPGTQLNGLPHLLMSGYTNPG